MKRDNVVQNNRRDAETQRESETLRRLSLIQHAGESLGGFSGFRNTDSIFQNVFRRERSWMISLQLRALR